MDAKHMFSRTLLANGKDVKVVAHNELKVDALALACGRPMFVDDVKFEGTLTAKILASPHEGLTCSSCHDAHASTKYDADAPGDGVHTACTTCHGDVVVNAPHDAAATCMDCHMAKTSKSATKSTIGEGDDALTYGDIAGHLFTFSLEPDATLTYKDAEDNEFTNAEVPVIYACKKCHADKTVDAAISGAAAIHATD